MELRGPFKNKLFLTAVVSVVVALIFAAIIILPNLMKPLLDYELSSDGSYYVLTSWCATNEKETEVEVPSVYKGVPVKVIGQTGEDAPFNKVNWLFLEDRYIKSVILPSSIERIEVFNDDAENNRANVQRIDINSEVLEIKALAFSGMNIQELNFLNIKSLKADGFGRVAELNYYCSIETLCSFELGRTYFDKVYINNEEITQLIIPTDVERIGTAVFFNWDCLETVYIPSTVKSVGEDAFGECDNLDLILYEGTIEEWRDICEGYYEVKVKCTDGTIIS